METRSRAAHTQWSPWVDGSALPDGNGAEEGPGIAGDDFELPGLYFEKTFRFPIVRVAVTQGNKNANVAHVVGCSRQFELVFQGLMQLFAFPTAPVNRQVREEGRP